MPAYNEEVTATPFAPGAIEAAVRRAPGFERARVTHAALLSGGASNITCRVDLEAAPVPAAVLRVQRERGIFEPYDVLREGEVLRRLAGGPVPAPVLYHGERDAAVLGAPYLLMEWVDAPHMGEAGAEASYAAFIEAVVAIHHLDWRAHGLGFLGVPATARDALAAELDAVAGRIERFAPRGDGLLAAALDTLRATIPEDGELRFCQGDINVYNYLFRRGRVVAVVDWEQARISDVRSDIGQMLALALLKGAPWGPAGSQPFAFAYAAASGIALQGLAWARARWLLDLAAIYHGWKAFNGSEPWFSREAVDAHLERALDELR
jgi:aminoglycoside phosphotransferase (APT) family kinase protein